MDVTPDAGGARELADAARSFLPQHLRALSGALSTSLDRAGELLAEMARGVDETLRANVAAIETARATPPMPVTAALAAAARGDRSARHLLAKDGLLKRLDEFQGVTFSYHQAILNLATASTPADRLAAYDHARLVHQRAERVAWWLLAGLDRWANTLGAPAAAATEPPTWMALTQRARDLVEVEPRAAAVCLARALEVGFRGKLAPQAPDVEFLALVEVASEAGLELPETPDTLLAAHAMLRRPDLDPLLVWRLVDLVEGAVNRLEMMPLPTEVQERLAGMLPP